MKHLNQKLLACFLSFLTFLSLLSQPVSALTLSEANNYGVYTASGSGTTQGPLPDDIINVDMPTARNNLFDVKVDPNNIIRLSGAEYHKVNGKTPRIGAGNVFFTNIDSSTGDVSFTRNSDRLNIINKGNVPLSVTLQVRVDKGDNDFTFASTPGFKDENGNPISGPALYLALTTGSVRTPVLPVTEKDEDTGEDVFRGYLATSVGWIANNEDAYYLTGDREEQRYYYARNPSFTENDFASTTFYMTGAVNDEGWGNQMGAFSLGIVWRVTEEKKGPDKDPNADKNIYPWADTLFAASDSTDAADLYVNYGSGDSKMSVIDGIAYTTMGGSFVSLSAAEANLTVEGSYVSVPATRAMFTGSDWKLHMTGPKGSCYVPFSLKETNAPLPIQEEGDESPSVNVTKAASAQNDWVEMTVNFGSMTKVTSFTYVMSTGEESTLDTAANIEINGPSVKVRAFKGAWVGSGWRLNLEDDAGAVASVYFDLKQTGIIQQPVVVTTTKATAQNEYAVLKVYMNNMTEITGLKYRTTARSYSTVPYSNVTTFPETTLPEVQVRAFKGVWNGAYPSLEFKNGSGETFSARFAIK